MSPSLRRTGLTIVLGVIMVLVLSVGGCLPAEYLPTYPNNSSRIAEDFLTTLEVGMESENLQDIARVIDDRYGGYSNGRRTLMDQLGEVFDQYEVQELQLDARRVTPYRGGITVRTAWTLRWVCRSVNPENGCPEEAKGTTVVREGTTTFDLVQKEMRWVVQDQTGNVLLGLFEPGESVE